MEEASAQVTHLCSAPLPPAGLQEDARARLLEAGAREGHRATSAAFYWPEQVTGHFKSETRAVGSSPWWQGLQSLQGAGSQGGWRTVATAEMHTPSEMRHCAGDAGSATVQVVEMKLLMCFITYEKMGLD